MRLISLQEIDYADITFNIPHALIFGALEPSVGVTLACLPLLRPLLRRQDYSTDGSKRYNVSGQDEHEHTGSATARGGLGGHQKDGFTTIDDDSEHQLRPVGPKHHVAIKSKRRDDGRMSSDNDESIGEEQAGIFVRQEWSVTK